ncbi:MAG: hypothetical protein WC497_06230 [Patescibacteria group bacterium]
MKNDRKYPNGTSRLAKPRLEKFAFYRAGGKTLAEAYALAGAKIGISSKSAQVGGSRLIAIPSVRARVAYLSEQVIATKAHAFSPEQGLIPKMPKEALLARLWQAVNAGSNPEAIAAAKLLRDWLREDEQDSKAQQISDPAIIAGHILSISGDYAGLDDAGRAAYCRRMIDSLGTLGLPRADFQAALAPEANRANAQTPDPTPATS